MNETTVNESTATPGPWTIESAAAALRRGEVTSAELTEQAQRAADDLNPVLGTWIRRFDDSARSAAEQADQELAAGQDRGPLHGIPLGIKDIIATDEGPTTAQSLVLDPAWGEQGDGPVMERLRHAGAIIMGKTTTMEFAVGRPDLAIYLDNDDAPFPLPRNPWNPDRWTGGSSSGTGSGVASGQILGGLGTDTGGSVRLPAAYNGISGHKPTFGLVPKSGCVPLGMQYDHIGPMARSAWDCAAMLSVMAGRDPSDRTTVEREPVDYIASIGCDLAGARIGVVSNDYMRAGCAEATLEVFDRALDELRDVGAELVDIEIPYYGELARIAFLALQAEAFAWHRKYLQTRWADYGRPTRLTLIQGALISAGDLVQLERVRQVARRAVLAAFDAHRVDVVLSPTTGHGASAFRGADRAGTSNRSLQTPAWNSTGFPALSVPMGFDPDGLPLGLQIVGRPFEDATVLDYGHAYQQITDWHRRTPPHSVT